MAWSSSNRRERFNPGWERTRKLILERDHHRCQWPVTDEFGFTHICGRPANQVDHKVRNPSHDDDSSENLHSLCQYHHEQKTCQESAEQRRKNRERRKEEEWYSHPAYRRTVS